MPLVPGARLGSYEIVRALGAGGMGEVYRARDTRLGRDIAIKILPSGFVNDQDRVARFRREAQLLAALNHTHIAAIHGLEDADGTLFLVLELVEGETLADRLKQGPLPLVDALAIARQVADALEAAHEKGIVHRDLKPANIALTADGHVKVLDFGLAKATDPATSVSELSMSPTLSLAATQAGTILGTAAYMSPEQAKGRPTDKRTDVWAFGCVLYEMLTGKHAFDGEDITDIIAAVVRGEPDWSALPADVPEQIRLLVKRCLDKDRRTRISDIGVVRFLLTETLPAPPPTAVAAHAAVQLTSRRHAVVMMGLGVLAGTLVASLGTWALMRSGPRAAPLPVRFSLVPPANQPLSMQGADRDLAISPDGTSIVYRVTVGGLAQLAIQSLADLEPRLLANTTNARSPFFSPDSRWIGFFGDESSLKRVLVSGGPALSIGRYTGGPRGASWGPDDTVIFAGAGVAGGLFSVAARGGEPKVLTKPDSGQGESGHWFPSILPGGRAVLFTVVLEGVVSSAGIAPGSMDKTSLAVLDLATGKIRPLIPGGSQPEFVAPGHLVYRSSGTLRSVRFDPARLEVLSDPIPVLDQTSPIVSGAGEFSISRTGTLAYLPGTASAAISPRSLVWVTRQGKEEPIAADKHAYALARISPDGTRVALDVRDQGAAAQIWILELDHSTLPPLSRDTTTNNMNPLWMDRHRVMWTGGPVVANLGLVWQVADGTGKMEKLVGTESPGAPFATSALGDGARILFFRSAPETSYDILMATMGPDGKPNIETLIGTPDSEINPEISPDGRWLAYQSNKGGRNQIWVRPFPNVDGGQWQVSTSGGSRPLWSRDGRELYYLDAGNFLTVVPVEAKGSAFTRRNATRLLSTAYYPGASPRGVDLRSYDVARDGRFLMVKEAGQNSQGASQSPTITVVLNWIEELKAKVPTP